MLKSLKLGDCSATFIDITTKISDKNKSYNMLAEHHP